MVPLVTGPNLWLQAAQCGLGMLQPGPALCTGRPGSQTCGNHPRLILELERFKRALE